jgi:hypothetical protein
MFPPDPSTSVKFFLSVLVLILAALPDARNVAADTEAFRCSS